MFSFRLLSLQDVTIWTKLDNSWKTFGLKTSLVVWLHYNSNTLITLQNNLDFRSLRWLLLIFASCEWVKGIVLMLFLGMPMHEYNLVFSPDQVSLEWNYTHTSMCNNLMYNTLTYNNHFFLQHYERMVVFLCSLYKNDVCVKNEAFQRFWCTTYFMQFGRHKKVV